MAPWSTPLSDPGQSNKGHQAAGGHNRIDTDTYSPGARVWRHGLPHCLAQDKVTKGIRPQGAATGLTLILIVQEPGYGAMVYPIVWSRTK